MKNNFDDKEKKTENTSQNTNTQETDGLTKEKLEELFEKIYNENKELFDRLS